MEDSVFIFKGHREDLKKGEAFFQFSLKKDGKTIDFEEKITFPSVSTTISKDLSRSIFDNLMLILGISYWKVYAPKGIEIEKNFLNQEMAQFWNKVYEKGLGEFFYKNKIDFHGLIDFPFVEKETRAVSIKRKNRSLLLLGGGKDSIVASEILKKENKPFDILTVGTSQIQENVAELIGKKPAIIKRELDPKLFDLNSQEGVYNGHIPISVVYAFLGVLASIFYDYSEIIVGNEESSNYGNVNYLGETINHQWSKSEEFEKLFQEYIHKYIAADISYKSVLRSLDELGVAEEFVKYPKYFKVFSSCNNNFKIHESANINSKWCGKCAKCLFVFTLLASFLSKKELLDIFGKNLFEDSSLLNTFQELLGLKDVKPFECVGTPSEMKKALIEIEKKEEFSDTVLMQFFKQYEA